MVLTMSFANVFIPAAALLAIAFGAFMWKRVSAISMTPGQSVYRSQATGREYLLEEESRTDDEVRELGCSCLAPRETRSMTDAWSFKLAAAAAPRGGALGGRQGGKGMQTNVPERVPLANTRHHLLT